MAHSLGNVAASSAIMDHAAVVSQYYALNAEACGDSAPNTNMVPQTLLARNAEGLLSFRGQSWLDYPTEMRAARWYERFTPPDSRAKLTWRHRFLDIQDKTDAFNFYSSTEDVLRVGSGHTTFLSTVQAGGDSFLYIPTSFEFGSYAWHIQEIYKGRGGFFDEGLFPGLLGGGSSDYAGWDFVKESDHYIHDFFGLDLWPVSARTWRERLASTNPDRDDWLAVVRDDPLFQHTPAPLFGAGAEAFAGGTVGENGGSLDYNAGNGTVPLADVKMRDWLLAKAFPATTRPMGSAPHTNLIWSAANFDMSDPNNGFKTSKQNWFRNTTYNGIKEWRHSDLGDAPYVHVYRLFEKITGKEQ